MPPVLSHSMLPLFSGERECAEDLRAATAGYERDSTIEETLDWLPLTSAGGEAYNRPFAKDAPPPPASSSECPVGVRGELPLPEGPEAFPADDIEPDDPTASLMEPTVAQFLERLQQSRLMTAAEVEALRKKVPADQLATDAQKFARDLVQQRKLTKYQAAALYQGKTKGLVLGSYVILERIGAGGMGEVFKARHRRLERLAAVKILPAKRVESPDAVRRFHQEVKAAAKLTHPNIVIAHDADEDDGIHYLVMEHVDGRDMGQVVKQDGRAELAGGLPVAIALDYILQAANGLEFAHKRGIIHRDIKPRNLIVDPHGVVKILDMGLARDDSAEARESAAAEAEEDVTHAGQIMGSVDFMSPEQAIDSRTADARSDIYSLGCTLYALLTAGVPFKGDTLVKKILAHREAAIPSLRTLRPDVPARLDALLQKMLAKTPEERPQAMGEVVTELRQCVLGLERSEVLPPPVAAHAEARTGEGSGGVGLGGDSGSSVSTTPSSVAPAIRRAPPRAPLPMPPLAGDTDRSCDPTIVGQEEIIDAEIVEEPAAGSQPLFSFGAPLAPPPPPEPSPVSPRAEAPRAPEVVADAVVFEEAPATAPAAPPEPAAAVPAPPPAPEVPPVPAGPNPILEFLKEYGVVFFAVLALVGVLSFLGYLILGH